jgi:hypothetical protein
MGIPFGLALADMRTAPLKAKHAEPACSLEPAVTWLDG